jgi:hypothetical protein
MVTNPVNPSSGGMFSSFSEGFNNLLQNKDFLRALAGTGAALDPQGVGGALGGATQDMIGSQAQQANLEALIKALGPGGKVQVKPDGSTSLQVGQPGEGQGGQQSGLGTLEKPATQEETTTTEQQTNLLDSSFGGLVDTFYQKIMGGL